MQAVLAVI